MRPMKQFSVSGSQFSVAVEMKQVSQMVGRKAKRRGHGGWGANRNSLQSCRRCRLLQGSFDSASAPLSRSTRCAQDDNTWRSTCGAQDDNPWRNACCAQDDSTWRLVLRGLDFYLRWRQRPGRLCRICWSCRRRGRRHGGSGGCLANLDAVVFVVEHNMRCAVADRATGLGLVLIAVNFYFREV